LVLRDLDWLADLVVLVRRVVPPDLVVPDALVVPADFVLADLVPADLVVLEDLVVPADLARAALPVLAAFGVLAGLARWLVLADLEVALGVLGLRARAAPVAGVSPDTRN